MRKTGWIALGAVAALAACSKPTPGHDNAAAGGPAANAAAANVATATPSAAPGGAAATMAGALNPGEWETAIEMKMTGLPANVPPEAAKAMQGMKTVTRHCLTPEKAAKPSGDLFGKPAQGCSNQQFSLTGGHLHGQVSCKSPQGTNSTMTMDGQYGGDSFDMTMTMTGEQAGRSMTWQSHSVGHRVAPSCSAATKDD